MDTRKVVLAQLKEMKSLVANFSDMIESLTAYVENSYDSDSSDEEYESTDESDGLLPPPPSLIREETGCPIIYLDISDADEEEKGVGGAPVIALMETGSTTYKFGE